jgi:hypothetical protein
MHFWFVLDHDAVRTLKPGKSMDLRIDYSEKTAKLGTNTYRSYQSSGSILMPVEFKDASLNIIVDRIYDTKGQLLNDGRDNGTVILSGRGETDGTAFITFQKK